MIRKVQRAWFEVWGSEQAQNQFLKGLLAMTSTLLLLFSITTCHLALKAPMLIAVSPKDTRILSIIDPNINLLSAEVELTLKKYLKERHTWTPDSIEKAAKKASSYVQSKFRKKFRAANKNQIKIAKKRNVSQKMYVYGYQNDLKKGLAILEVDRILNIDGVRSTRPMTFEVRYSFGDRTEENPEGIYVTDEKLIHSLN